MQGLTLQEGGPKGLILLLLVAARITQPKPLHQAVDSDLGSQRYSATWRNSIRGTSYGRKSSMDRFQGTGLRRCAAQSQLDCRLSLLPGQAICCQLCASACHPVNQGRCPRMPTMAICGVLRADQSKREKVSAHADEGGTSPRLTPAP